MRATIWGCRGSLATPGEHTVRYGGNTTSVAVRTETGRLVVLDAGTGIRPLGLSLAEPPARIDLLLTHLHLDHVEGLGFFAPLFDAECEITIWGPPQEGSSLRDRIAAYLSPPFFPIPFELFGGHVRFAELGEETWELDSLRITSRRVCHPGPTFGYRLEEQGRVFGFVPDNELGLDGEAGLEIAEAADLLFHDAQYTAEEYATRSGWGHTSVSDLAPFLAAAAPKRAVLVHHDPTHGDDVLESMKRTAEELTGRELALGAEGAVYEV